MPMTEAQKRASKKWDKENTRRVSIVLNNNSKTNYEAVKAAADAQQKSVNSYIIEAIDEKMTRQEGK